RDRANIIRLLPGIENDRTTIQQFIAADNSTLAMLVQIPLIDNENKMIAAIVNKSTKQETNNKTNAITTKKRVDVFFADAQEDEIDEELVDDLFDFLELKNQTTY